jgi:hypothetical protein
VNCSFDIKVQSINPFFYFGSLIAAQSSRVYHTVLHCISSGSYIRGRLPARTLSGAQWMIDKHSLPLAKMSSTAIGDPDPDCRTDSVQYIQKSRVWIEAGLPS